jgi:GDPmannose 4,6-dehydratase
MFIRGREPLPSGANGTWGMRGVAGALVAAGAGPGGSGEAARLGAGELPPSRDRRRARSPAGSSPAIARTIGLRLDIGRILPTRRRRRTPVTGRRSAILGPVTKTALITGVTGQDGSYLAELLLDEGYRVVGMTRRSSTTNDERIAHLVNRLEIVQGDLLDQASLVDALVRVAPDEVYNLAAQSFVPTSWNQPVLTGEFTGLGVTRMLEAIRQVDRPVRFYQASSSEMFGKVREVPQTERTPFHPRSPYGVAKAYGHFLTVNYRESYGMFAVSGILFNHESPRRGLEFVSRKITDGAARIAAGLAETLPMGNLDAERDWGYAGDYVRAMWRMLQRDEPTDYVIATGVATSVREFCRIAFERVGLNYEDHVTVDPALYRPAEVDHLRGDASRARAELGWQPTVDLRGLVEMMVDADVARYAAGGRPSSARASAATGGVAGRG